MVFCVAVSPDGALIVSGSWDRTVKVWDARSGVEKLTLKGHTGYVWSVAITSDGEHIVSGSDDGTVKVCALCIFPCIPFAVSIVRVQMRMGGGQRQALSVFI
jgi:WD40 repeat protein